ncbi:Tim44/TimA family putative adaptor protein [Magnetospirillum molischianum]|uniref:Tim44-like domain-containing protein n=1 Tax=Magnetospirillum molischianum DSM 120 TaxID=1150626 RepID=H8FN33_MAGML|nr:Tim44/TimA family putative adaptor protein [Magnetospirillum molischianum]CCG39771.1 conserved hypothetical protein [Magnetospirillum molischianum DSM 120]
MNDGFHYLDIIFFAMVAAFLVLRLRSVLGRRTGAEHPPERWGAGEPANNVVDLASARRSVSEPAPGTPTSRGLEQIRTIDRSFDLDTFLAGARAAFSMVVTAFAAGDRETLRQLLSPEVFANFVSVIDAHSARGESLTTELVSIRTVEPIDAAVRGVFLEITVRFVSEQVNLLRNAEGQVIEGNPDRIVNVTDEWTFRRDPRAADPNWLLVATRTPEE